MDGARDANENIMGLDSVEFTMEIEDAFEIKIPDPEAESIHTVGQAVECVLRHRTELTIVRPSVVERVLILAELNARIPLDQITEESRLVEDLGYD